MKNGLLKGVLMSLTLFAVSLCSNAQDLEAFSKKVTEHRLDNGLQFILVERHDAPLVSFHTWVDAGSVDEYAGITGLAHLFEHLAFKGTTTIGTNNIEAELAVYEKQDAMYDEMKRLKAKGVSKDSPEWQELQKKWDVLAEEVKGYIVEGEFDRTLERNGAVGLNAQTGADFTRYFFSLPSNRIELWANLESDRFANPVIREFYPERDVVQEERRLRVDSNPIGRMVEVVLGTAFHAHPYGYPVIGYMSDIQSVTRQEAEDFYRKHYNASTTTIVIAGDIEPKTLIPMLEKYFSRIPGGNPPDPVETIEPPQLGMKVVEVEDASQPVLLMGFHRPNGMHPDNAAYNAMADILGGGRSSRLNKRLVKEDQLCVQVGSFPSFPGTKYPTLFAFFAVPAQGKTVDEVEAAIWDEIGKIRTELVSQEELEGVKTRTKAALIGSLGDNAGLAMLLAEYQAITGDWRNLFREVDKISKVTPEDVMRVAKSTLVRKNCTLGKVVAPEEVE